MDKPYDKTLVTKGPWEVFESGLSKPKVVDQRGLIIADVSNFPKASIAEIAANAAFIAEAGTVLSETAMTPRELVDEVKRLREAAKPLVDRLAVVEQVKNARGVSATTVEMADLRGLRAALAPKENAAMPLVTVPIDKWCECSKRFVAACNCPAQVKPKDTADD